MSDDTDMTPAEFRAAMRDGLPVKIVTSELLYSAIVAKFEAMDPVKCLSVGFDDEANMVGVWLPPRERIVATEEVGRSVLAHYTVEDRLVCVEVLSIEACARPENLLILEGLLPGRAFRLLMRALSARAVL